MLDDQQQRTLPIAEAIEDAIAMFLRAPGIGWDVEAFSRRCGSDRTTSARIFRALEQLDFIRRRPDGLYVHDSSESSSFLTFAGRVLK